MLARPWLLLLILVTPAGCVRVQGSPANTFASVDAPVVALTNVRVIDGTGRPGRPNQTLIIRRGVIADVGDAVSVRPPSDSLVLDLSGRTVLPGFVMLHEHMFFSVDGKTTRSTPSSSAPLYLAAGATTVRTAGSLNWPADLRLRDAINSGEIAGPEIDLSSYIDAPLLPMLSFRSGAARGRRLAANWADDGATSFKAYDHLTRDELAGVIEEAHRRGLKVTGHLCAITFSEAADLGIDNIEHGLWTATDFLADKQPDVCPPSNQAQTAVLAARRSEIQRLIDKLVGRRVAITSTLPVFETFVSTREPAVPAALDLMAPDARQRYERRRAEIAANPHPGWLQLLEKEMEFERAFAQSGGLLVAGSDPTGAGGVVAGFSNHRAIQLLVEAGFTPTEAIQIATMNGARYLGREDRIGTIARGKQADLVVIRGDPEEVITALQHVETVFKKGIGYDSQKLRESVRGMVGVR